MFLPLLTPFPGKPLGKEEDNAMSHIGGETEAWRKEVPCRAQRAPPLRVCVGPRFEFVERLPLSFS